jgi:hypothetical protein
MISFSKSVVGLKLKAVLPIWAMHGQEIRNGVQSTITFLGYVVLISAFELSVHAAALLAMQA